MPRNRDIQDGAVIPLVIHGHILWSPHAPEDPDRPGQFPLIGQVHYQHLQLAHLPGPRRPPTCPVIDAETCWRMSQ
jgi:hypothetical protein